jgi:hypothetical protein
MRWTLVLLFSAGQAMANTPDPKALGGWPTRERASWGFLHAPSCLRDSRFGATIEGRLFDAYPAPLDAAKAAAQPPASSFRAH